MTASGSQPCSAMLSNMCRALLYSPPCAHAAIMLLNIPTSGCTFCASKVPQCYSSVVATKLSFASTGTFITHASMLPLLAIHMPHSIPMDSWCGREIQPTAIFYVIVHDCTDGIANVSCMTYLAY